MNNFKVALIIGTVFFVLTGCSNSKEINASDNSINTADNPSFEEDLEYKKMCNDLGYQWMLMKPTINGKVQMQMESCFGCMVEEVEHVCDIEKFREITGK